MAPPKSTSSHTSMPNKIGSLLFCPDCGTLLDLPGDDDAIKCSLCGRSEDARAYGNLTIVTRSHPTAFPSALRQKRNLVVKAPSPDERPKEATIKESCPKCGNEEMTYHTLQLRSADEGTTVFYECPKCAYKFSTNN